MKLQSARDNEQIARLNEQYDSLYERSQETERRLSTSLKETKDKLTKQVQATELATKQRDAMEKQKVFWNERFDTLQSEHLAQSAQLQKTEGELKEWQKKSKS